MRYRGVAAHAGAYPAKGVNALYAATLGLNAINAPRETFEEKDLIRVHPIITKGGAAGQRDSVGRDAGKLCQGENA